MVHLADHHRRGGIGGGRPGRERPDDSVAASGEPHAAHRDGDGPQPVERDGGRAGAATIAIRSAIESAPGASNSHQAHTAATAAPPSTRIMAGTLVANGREKLIILSRYSSA